MDNKQLEESPEHLVLSDSLGRFPNRYQETNSHSHCPTLLILKYRHAEKPMLK